ncbi:MAG: Hsp20/alpha crystallin family protein [archaeon]
MAKKHHPHHKSSKSTRKSGKIAKRQQKPRQKQKKRLPAILTPSLFERKFLSFEKEMSARFAEMEKKLAHFSGGMKMHDSPNATKVSFDGLAGFKKSEICLEVTDHTITVSAKNRNSAYYKSVSLPYLVVPERAKPDLKEGVLSVTLPKYKEKLAKVKRLRV